MQTGKKGVSFIGSLTLMATLIIFHSFFMENVSVRQLSMTFVYIMIALATDSYKGVIDLVERLWSINNNGDTADEKFALIKSFLQINVTKWDKYNNLYSEIVNNQKGISALRRYLMRIPKGTISLKQFIWIIGYIVYSVFSPEMIMTINPAVDFLIDLGGLAFFLFTGSSVIGLREFMGDIFESIKPMKNKSVKQALQLLESQIIYGSQHYSFLKNKINIKHEEK